MNSSFSRRAVSLLAAIAAAGSGAYFALGMQHSSHAVSAARATTCINIVVQGRTLTTVCIPSPDLGTADH